MVYKFQNVATFHGTRDRDIINQTTNEISGLCRQGSISKVLKKPDLRWNSHSPTPSAWGQTGGTPNLIDCSQLFLLKSQQRCELCYSAAIRSTLRTSLTPASPKESIWTTSIASASNSCLKIMRLCACSPVAMSIPCGLSAFCIAAWSRISSGGWSSRLFSEPWQKEVIDLCPPFDIFSHKLTMVFWPLTLWHNRLPAAHPIPGLHQSLGPPQSGLHSFPIIVTVAIKRLHSRR